MNGLYEMELQAKEWNKQNVISNEQFSAENTVEFWFVNLIGYSRSRRTEYITSWDSRFKPIKVYLISPKLHSAYTGISLYFLNGLL